jgi:sugar phosphate isomerase/epimerase
MKTIKGPALFLAQFAGDEAPFNSCDSITKWAADCGYKGVQIPSWDTRLFDLKKAAESRTYCDEIAGIGREKSCGDNRTVDPPSGAIGRCAFCL